MGSNVYIATAGINKITVADRASRLASSSKRGDYCTQLNNGRSYVLLGDDPTIDVDWFDRGVQLKCIYTGGSFAPNLAWWSKGEGDTGSFTAVGNDVYVIDPDKITSLSVNAQELDGIFDITPLINLQGFDCSNNLITSVKIAGMSSLVSLTAWSNELAEIDLTGCTSMAYLQVQDNHLTILDLRPCTNITTVDCTTNSITSFNANGCSSLATVQGYFNDITSVDLSGCVSMETLYLYNNQISAIDISDCSALVYLNLSTNLLTSLDVSGLENLLEVRLSFNSLDSVDVDSILIALAASATGNFGNGFFDVARTSASDAAFTLLTSGPRWWTFVFDNLPH